MLQPLSIIYFLFKEMQKPLEGIDVLSGETLDTTDGMTADHATEKDASIR